MLSDLAALASGRLTSVVLSFVTVLMTTRMLGPAGYGTVAVVGIVSMLIFTVSSAWSGISVRRYGREDLELRGTMNRLTWNRVVIVAPLAAVAVAIVLGLKLVGALPSILTWELVWIALGTAMVNIVSDHWICLLETSGKMKVSASVQVLSQALYVLGLAVPVAIGARGSPPLVLTISLASALALVLAAAPAVWRVGVVPATVDRLLLRRMLWLSAPMIGLMISQYVFASIDIFALHTFGTPTDVGQYAVAYQGYTVLAAVGVTATSVFVPLFVSLQLAGRQGLIVRYLDRGVADGTFLIAAVVGAAVPFVRLVVPVAFGHRFAAAAAPLAVLTIGVTFLYATLLVAPILTLHEATRATALINAIAALINVVGDVLLIGVFHVMGIVAPAIATSVALLFMFIAFDWRARRLLSSAGRGPNLAVVTPLIAGVVPTLALRPPVGTAVGVAAAVGTAGAILLWRSPFAADDAQLVAKLDLPGSVKAVAVRLIGMLA